MKNVDTTACYAFTVCTWMCAEHIKTKLSKQCKFLPYHKARIQNVDTQPVDIPWGHTALQTVHKFFITTVPREGQNDMGGRVPSLLQLGVCYPSLAMSPEMHDKCSRYFLLLKSSTLAFLSCFKDKSDVHVLSSYGSQLHGSHGKKCHRW
jgi:hypothetical protein